MAPLSIRAKSKVVRTLYALPKPVRRLMAGAPVRIDGQELDVDAQLAIRLKNASGSDVFTGAIEAARARYDELPGIIGYDPPVPVASRKIVIPTEHGGIPATLYTPADLTRRVRTAGVFSRWWLLGRLAAKPRPGCPLSWQATPVCECCRSNTDARPKHRFPAAVEDAVACVRICAPPRRRPGGRSRPHRRRGRQRRWESRRGDRAARRCDAGARSRRSSC